MLVFGVWAHRTWTSTSCARSSRARRGATGRRSCSSPRACTISSRRSRRGRRRTRRSTDEGGRARPPSQDARRERRARPSPCSRWTLPCCISPWSSWLACIHPTPMASKSVSRRARCSVPAQVCADRCVCTFHSYTSAAAAAGARTTVCYTCRIFSYQSSIPHPLFPPSPFAFLQHGRSTSTRARAPAHHERNAYIHQTSRADLRREYFMEWRCSGRHGSERLRSVHENRNVA